MVFTNKILQEIMAVFVTEVGQKYTVTCISAIFSDTVDRQIWNFDREI